MSVFDVLGIPTIREEISYLKNHKKEGLHEIKNED